MAIYGYLRVSTDQQDYNSQKQGVDDFAKKQGWNIDEYITDDGVSGSKDYHKRQLGKLLEKVKPNDVIIASEISRLGRDLLMVMEILNHCMKSDVFVYTVKDNYKLGDDVQSKVLAFAFGLSAEIERKMIQARTKEGLQLRVKKGVLLGRPPCSQKAIELRALENVKEKVIEQYQIGVPLRRLAQNFNSDRNTVTIRLCEWGVYDNPKVLEKLKKSQEKNHEKQKGAYWKDKELQIIENYDYRKFKILIEQDLTIPEIHSIMKEYTYDQVYDTIYSDKELNILYRKHGQKKIKGVK